MLANSRAATMRDYTLVFDLDGTLVDTAPDVIAAINYALGQFRLLPLEAEFLRPFVGHGAPKMLERAIEVRGETFSQAEHVALLEHFFDYYSSHIAVQSRPFNGVVCALEACTAAGAKLAVCTNKMERLARMLLEALDMQRLFAAVAGRDTFSASKPHPEHLLGTIRLAGGDPGRAVMIGDSSVDVATARAANVPVIGVSFGYMDAIETFTPNTVINHFCELQPAFERLLTTVPVQSTSRPSPPDHEDEGEDIRTVGMSPR